MATVSPTGSEKCGALKRTGEQCARSVHSTPQQVDSEPRCLMHSRDPEKVRGPLRDQFMEEIDAILEAAASHVADFTRFIFPPVTFNGHHFSCICDFSGAKFTGDAWFTSEVIFQQKVCFEDAHFERKSNFRKAIFEQEADFYKTHFHGEACFAEATFERSAYFGEAEFKQIADFHSAHFLGVARFRVTHFQLQKQKPSPVFSLASFSQVNTLFYKTHLEQALFINCDITKVNFSSVSWLRRPRNGKRMLFEEILPLDSEYATPLRTGDGGRDYKLVAEKYQQLKKNYDQRRDYWTAGNFHYGEMEMQRLSIHDLGRWRGFRSWWHPRFSLLAWYRYASSYGESYGRPAKLILASLLFFTLVFPLIGIRPNSVPQSISAQAPAEKTMTYKSVWPSRSPARDRFWAEAKLLVRSGVMTLDTATFERNPEFLPQYPWGRFVAILETLSTSALFALFLLALRRQFKR